MREPDIRLYLRRESASRHTGKGLYEAVPDLVVEVASPSNSQWELNDALMWLHYGVRLGWVSVYPDVRTVGVHREGHRVLTFQTMSRCAVSTCCPVSHMQTTRYLISREPLATAAPFKHI